jgi:uncharacterized protein (TIGR02444 family)
MCSGTFSDIMAAMSTVETGANGSPFWRFSLGFYRRPRVAPACLELQDAFGVDVNLLLFLLWLATERRLVPAEAVRSIDARIRHWRETAVLPLRAIRRALKGGAPPIDATTAEQFRTRIKAEELEAERLEQEALYAWARTEFSGGRGDPKPARSVLEAARANVAAYQAVVGREFPEATVDALLRALD